MEVQGIKVLDSVSLLAGFDGSNGARDFDISDRGLC